MLCSSWSKHSVNVPVIISAPTAAMMILAFMGSIVTLKSIATAKRHVNQESAFVVLGREAEIAP